MIVTADDDKVFSEAFLVVRKYFPQFENDQILQGLAICQRAGGLYTMPRSKPTTVLATFRYHPLEMVDNRRMLEVVEQFDLETLATKPLVTGPCLHVVAFVTDLPGYTTFQSMMRVLNPFAISVHRWNHAENRFRLKHNPHFKPAGGFTENDTE